MAKIIDKITFSIAFCLVGYSVCIKFFKPWASVTITALAYVTACTLFFVRSVKRPTDKRITASELPLYFALMDRKAQTAHFYNLIPDDMKIKMNSPYIVYEAGGRRKMIAVLYRFINLTQEDIASAYREGKKENISEITVLTRYKERKTITLCAFLDIPFRFPDKYTVHRALKRHNALLLKPSKKQKITRTPIDWRTLLDTVLEPKKVKFYLIISLILALTSFLTPLKTYYLITASIPLILGTIGLIKNAKT